jgi:AcrR family transcriptional regulator
MSISMARLTRKQKKDLTRSQLLKAARKAFLRRGFHRASLEEVAEEADLTTGAIYSNFEGKSDLFLALLEEHIERRVQEIYEATAGRQTLEDLVRRDARRSMGQELEWNLLLMEFWTYAARDPRLRQELAARHFRLLEAGAKLLEEAAAELGETLLLPALHLARAVSAMQRGIALERLVDPEGVPEDLLESMLGLFFREATAPAEGVSERSTQNEGTIRAERGQRDEAEQMRDRGDGEAKPSGEEKER